MTPMLLVLALVQAAALAPPPALRLGFAKRAITPAIGAKPVYMAGFDNDRKATGVHDDLWARAVAVGDGRLKIAIVSVDLIGIFHADVLKAREALQGKAPPRRSTPSWFSGGSRTRRTREPTSPARRASGRSSRSFPPSTSSSSASPTTRSAT